MADAGATNAPDGRAAPALTDEAVALTSSAVDLNPLAVTARLFDADRTDRVVALTPEAASDIPDRCLLWVDAIGDDAAAIDSLFHLIGVDVTAAWILRDEPTDPSLQLHGTYFHLHVDTIETDAGRERASSLDLIAGRNFVLTLHDEPIGFMNEFNERVKRDTKLGQIDSTAFAAVILDALVTSYLRLADEFEAEVDRLDSLALRPAASSDLLGDLVALRHRIAMARRELTDHREVFAALTRPDLEAVAGSTGTEYFQTVAARFERAIEAVEGTRDSLLGTFDIHANRTAQRTNDIVKILTVVSVLLLPTTVIAGFMGMNIKPPYSNDNPAIFWIVLAAIVIIAVGTLVVLRLRRWL